MHRYRIKARNIKEILRRIRIQHLKGNKTELIQILVPQWGSMVECIHQRMNADF